MSPATDRFRAVAGGRSRELGRDRGDTQVSNPSHTSKSVRDTQQGGTQ